MSESVQATKGFDQLCREFCVKNTKRQRTKYERQQRGLLFRRVKGLEPVTAGVPGHQEASR